MLVCYPPYFPPMRVGELPSDTGSYSVLLYDKFWLSVRFEGLRTAPRVVEASVSLHGRKRPIAPERVIVFSKSQFEAWYATHNQTYRATLRFSP